MQETKQKECGMCCSLVPPRCINKDCVCHTETKQKWEEEFDRKVPAYSMNEYSVYGDKIRPLMVQRKDVIEFISTLLSEDRAKTVEIVEKLEQPKDPHSPFWQLGFERARNTILKLLNNRE